MWETWVRSLGREDPLEEGMAAHSSSYLEEEPGQRSLVGYSPQGNRRVRHDEVTNTLRIYLRNLKPPEHSNYSGCITNYPKT